MPVRGEPRPRAAHVNGTQDAPRRVRMRTVPPASPTPLQRLGRWLFGLALGATLVLAPTLFADHHRFGDFALLFLVSLLHALWVVNGVLGQSLRHLQCWAHLGIWALLALVLIQTLPLPLAQVVDNEDPAVAAEANALIEPLRGAGREGAYRLPTVRLARRPAAATGVLMLLAGAAGLYWLVSSAQPGRRGARWVTRTAVLGFALLAYWVLMGGGGWGRLPPGVARLVGPALVLGGDSLVPALLAALPMTLLIVVRVLGWMPRRAPARRENRWGWLDRAATIRISIALVIVALVAVALGLSHVPRHVLVVCVTLAVGFLLMGYVVTAPAQIGLRKPLAVALGLALWVALALWLGTWVGRGPRAASRADPVLETVLESLPVERQALGLGAGAVSPRAVFGRAGWPVAPGDDVDTDGFLLLRAEIGWVGLGLVLVGAAVYAVRILGSWRGHRGPWAKMVVPAAFGVLTANLLYFRFDASAVLAPNLLALAAAVGVVTAWTSHGVAWHPERTKELAESRWPLVAAAVGLLGALGLAENQMLSATGGGGGFSDKVLHFGTFSVVSLLLCYALGPKPTTHRLGARILLAVVCTTALGATIEVGQALLTEGRSFEWLDMAANAGGATLMAMLWWVVRRGQAAAPAV